MRRSLLFMSGLVLSVSLSYADLTEKVTTKVSFGGTGTLTSTSTTCYKGLIKSDVSQSNFDGSGFKGKMISAFFPKGENGTIYNLPEKNIYSINYENKSYTISQIEKFFQQPLSGMEEDTGATDDNDEQEEGPIVKVIRSDFKVVDTGQQKQTAGFDTHEYQIISVYEVEYLDTHAIKTDSLFVDLWNTDDTGIFDRANAEKAEFNRELFSLMGIEFEDAEYEKMLGLNWLKILQSADIKSQMSGEGQTYDFSQMKKIQGYPVIIDGTLFTRTFDPNQQQEEAVSDDDNGSESVPTSVSGLAGRFGSKLKKKAQEKVEKKKTSPDEYKQSLAYYMETESISFDSVSDSQISVPEGFKLNK